MLQTDRHPEKLVEPVVTCEERLFPVLLAVFHLPVTVIGVQCRKYCRLAK